LSTGGHGWGSGPILVPNTNNSIVFNDEDGALNSTLYNEALAKLTDSVRGDLDLSVDLAEWHQTAKMFNVTDKLVDYTHNFTRKASFAKALIVGGVKSASNAWLEYVYGVKPLLSSIHGLAEENLRTVINKVSRHSARASGKYEPRTVTIQTIYGPWTNPILKSDLKRSFTFGIDLRDDQFDIARYSSLNPISIAWELTPYSFVADWVFNVGGYLRQYETYLLFANKFRGGFLTTLTVGDVTWDWGRTSIPGYKVNIDRFHGDAHVMSLDRTLLSSYPAPRFPSFKAQLGSSRLLSAAALLGQMLQGRPDAGERYVAYTRKWRKQQTRNWYNRRS